MIEDIKKQFDTYSSIDYRDNFSINEIFEYFDETKLTRGFTTVKKSGYWETDKGIAKYQSIELFARLLKDHGNLEYAKKEAGIGQYLARKYMLLLNDECEKRGLPLIFNRKKRKHSAKLNEKQVSYIKYLMHKYPAPVVAAMYSVAFQTILQIKKGLTWKDVKPVIRPNNSVIYVNQFLSKLHTPKQLPLFTPPSEDFLLKRLRRNRWGKSAIKCPFCRHDKQYYNELENRYKCANPQCYKKYSPLTGTIYEGTKLPLAKWCIVELELSKPNHLSSIDLAKYLSLTQKTVWKMMNKIRKNPFNSLLLTENSRPVNY
jgi:transposase-like protein